MFSARYGSQIAIAAGFVVATTFTAFAEQGTAAKISPRAPAEAETQPDVSPAFTFEIEVPTVRAVGASIDEATLKAIFQGDIAGHADQLRHLDAQSITVPTITLTYDLPMTGTEAPVSATVVYKDIVISDVNDGLAGSLSIASASVEEPEATITYGSMTSKDVNFGAMLGFYGLVDAGADTGWQTLYRDVVMSGATIEAASGHCTIGRIDLASAQVRPVKSSFLDVFSRLQQSAAEIDEKPDPKMVGELFGFVAEIATAIKTDPVTSEGLDCSFDDAGDTVSISVGGLEVGAYQADGIYPEISADALDISADDGTVSIGSFVLKPIDYNSALAAFATVDDSVDDAWFEAHAREFIPALHGVAIENVLVDVPNHDAPDEHIKGSIAAFDLSLDNYRNAIPTSVSSRLDALVLEIPEDSADPSMVSLRQMGLEKLQLGYDLNARWNEADQTIAFDKVKIDAGPLGSAALSLLLGQATADLFSSDTDKAMQAGLGITLKSLGLDVVDTGLGDLFFAQAAAESGVKAKDMRIMMSGVAQGMVLGFLGGNPAASELATAVGKLVTDSTPLSATLTANDPNGIALDALEDLESNPTALGDMITIETGKPE